MFRCSNKDKAGCDWTGDGLCLVAREKGLGLRGPRSLTIFCPDLSKRIKLRADTRISLVPDQCSDCGSSPFGPLRGRERVFSY